MQGLTKIARLLLMALAVGAASGQAPAQTPAAPPHAPLPTPAASVAMLAVAPLPGARLAAGQPIPPAELEAFVDGVVSQAMARDHIAGATVSVVQSGQLVMKKGYGYANLARRTPVDPDLSLFRVGSISKTFTWILVLKQVEAGRMSLDRPINVFLPESLRISDQGYARPVRVRDLMNHSPGFEDQALGQLFERDYARVRTLQTYLRQERPRRVRESGTLPSYSNYGAALAGRAVVELTGVPFERLVETEITGPLGMTHTTFREPHPIRKDMPAPMAAGLAHDVATPYHWAGTTWRAEPFEYVGHVAPAGAASATAADMSRYMLAILGGGALEGVAIYGPATAQAFATPQPAPVAGMPAWRHGLVEYDLPGGFTGVGHDGATLAFMSNMVLIPDLGLGIFISTNTDTGGGLAHALPERIVQRFYAGPPPAPAPGSHALVRDRAAYEGVYLTTRRAYHGLEGFIFRIIGAVRVSVTPDGALTIAERNGAARFAPVGPPLSGRFIGPSDPAPLVFQMRDGRAVRFFPPPGAITYERIGFFGQTGALIVLSTLVAFCAVATLGGMISRMRRDFRESSAQQRAGMLQSGQAVLWLLAMALFGIWSAGTSDIAEVMYAWPGFLIILASACALVAAMMAVASVVFVPLVWRGGRRVDSWTGGRKARFTFTALVFLAYAVLLGAWGALEPWSA